MFDIYFSIVRRRAACASRDSESASLMMTTMCIVKVSIRSFEEWSRWDGMRGRQTFKSLLCVQIHLLRLRYLLQQLLYYHSIKISGLAVPFCIRVTAP